MLITSNTRSHLVYIHRRLILCNVRPSQRWPVGVQGPFSGKNRKIVIESSYQQLSMTNHPSDQFDGRDIWTSYSTLACANRDKSLPVAPTLLASPLKIGYVPRTNDARVVVQDIMRGSFSNRERRTLHHNHGWTPFLEIKSLPEFWCMRIVNRNPICHFSFSIFPNGEGITFGNRRKVGVA